MSEIVGLMISPRRDQHGVPWCSQADCQQYDRAYCILTSRFVPCPDSICLPQARLDAEELGWAREQITRLGEVVNETISKLKFVLDFVPCEEGLFTFPDGDTWEAGKKANMNLRELAQAHVEIGELKLILEQQDITMHRWHAELAELRALRSRAQERAVYIQTHHSGWVDVGRVRADTARYILFGDSGKEQG